MSWQLSVKGNTFYNKLTYEGTLDENKNDYILKRAHLVLMKLGGNVTPALRPCYRLSSWRQKCEMGNIDTNGHLSKGSYIQQKGKLIKINKGNLLYLKGHLLERKKGAPIRRKRTFIKRKGGTFQSNSGSYQSSKGEFLLPVSRMWHSIEMKM